MKVGVLTVTKREGWEQVAEASLASQTFQGFDWVVVHEPEVTISAPRAKVIVAPPKKRVSNLSASNNAGLKQFKGYDYVIFYQDFIVLPPDCFQKLIKVAEETSGFVSTITLNDDGSKDLRDLGTNLVRPCKPEEWEENVAIAPMQALEILGGYDEEYDDGWAWNNCNVAERAEMLHYPFYIDESIRPQLLYHPKETSITPNGEFHAQRMKAIRNKEFPLRLRYL